MLEEIIKLDKEYYMNTFGDRLPVAFEKGNGINLYSTDGEMRLRQGKGPVHGHQLE